MTAMNYWPHGYQTWPNQFGSCPSCGRCNDCGRGGSGFIQYPTPWWQQPTTTTTSLQDFQKQIDALLAKASAAPEAETK